MEDLDSKIITLLQQDGRVTNARMAKEIGVSEGTIRRRIRMLVQEEFIQTIVVLDSAKVGYSYEALIGIQVDPDKLDRVVDEIAKLEEINWVAITTGAYDVFAWSTMRSAKELGVFLTTRLGTIPGIHRTETFVNLSIKKRGYGIAM